MLYTVKGSGRKKLTIRNALYRRFINSDRGGTPRSARTRGVAFRLTDTSVFPYIRDFPFSERSSRIYRIHGQDLLFTQLGCDSGPGLAEVARTLCPNDIALVFRQDSQYMYYYVNRVRGEASSLDDLNLTRYMLDASDTYLPGFYYQDGSWYYMESIDADVSPTPRKVSREFISEVAHSKEAVSESVINRLDPVRVSTTGCLPMSKKEAPVLQEGLENAFARGLVWYIPKDRAETPILQAYLPIELGVEGERVQLGYSAGSAEQGKENRVLWSRGARNSLATTVVIGAAKTVLQAPSYGTPVYLGFGPKVPDSVTPEYTDVSGQYSRYFSPTVGGFTFVEPGTVLASINYPAYLSDLPIEDVHGVFNNAFWTLSGRVSDPPAYPLTLKVYYPVYTPTPGFELVEVPGTWSFYNSAREIGASDGACIPASSQFSTLCIPLLST